MAYYIEIDGRDGRPQYMADMRKQQNSFWTRTKELACSFKREKEANYFIRNKRTPIKFNPRAVSEEEAQFNG